MFVSSSRIAKGRRGVSLTEALIAVGILTIGLISLLSLFPVGAIRMAQAVRDDRVAMLSANGDTLFRAHWRGVALVANSAPDTVVPRAILKTNAPWTTRLDRASDGLTGAAVPTPASLLVPDASTGLSWPVLLDPIGINAYAGDPTKQAWAGSALGFIRRFDPGLRQGPVLSPLANNIRYTYTTDDVTFGKNGAPDTAGGSVERAERYSYAWLVQRPDNTIYDEVRLRILTFQNRAPSIDQSKEEAYSLTAFSTTGVTISTTTNPIFRKGQWVLMAYQPIASTVAANPNPFVTAYRVLSLNQTSATTWEVEFQQPIPSGSTPITQLRLIAFDSLVEVFDRGIISPHSIPGFSNAK